MRPDQFRRFHLALLFAACALSSGQVRAESSYSHLVLRPEGVTLRGKAAGQQITLSGWIEGREVDLTRKARFESQTPDVIQVDSKGIVRPVGDGSGLVTATIGDAQAQLYVEVARADRFLPVTLELDVQPILARFGCDAGACHGKAGGQNGFQLSLLGFDSDFDYNALVKEGRGRRVFPAAPERSLILQKPSSLVPHGGGRRFEPHSAPYEVLSRWVAHGMPRAPADAPVLDHVSVEPAERVMAADETQQLLVTAHYSDGSRRDVTHLAAYQSSESPIAAVDEQGVVTAGPITGEVAIMARYMGKIAICEVAIPLPGTVDPELYKNLPERNFIDRLVWNKLQRLGLTPSEPCDDATFLRRASLDVIGRTATPDETRAFLADNSPDKRARLVDRLLERPEYADFWANKWADLLRPNPYRVGIKAVLNLDAWLRDSFRKNKPYDQFVRELVTAQGSTFRNGAVTIFRDRRSPDEIATMVSQLFLGVRLECAKCHHHPFEVWAQEDFYSFAAYFARIGRKGTGLSPPISGSEEMMFVSDKGSVQHPRTGETLAPRPLFGKAPAIEPREDPRRALAEWMTSDDNPYFAQVIANRVWADLMGRGIVEPVDDLRATNPPTNAPLLEALADDFRKSGYDLKALIRRIMNSYVYGLSSLPTERNTVDTRNYSRYYRQRLRAEVLLDAVSDITGVPEEFSAMPPGSRAMAIWTHRAPSLFLDTFGRPDPNQDPPCERTPDTTVVQALHLMNAPRLNEKITSDQGRARKLAESDRTPAQLIEELYLWVYSRPPTQEELASAVKLYEDNPDARRQVTEDLLWALLNTPEFVFKN